MQLQFEATVMYKITATDRALEKTLHKLKTAFIYVSSCYHSSVFYYLPPDTLLSSRSLSLTNCKMASIKAGSFSSLESPGFSLMKKK